MVCEYSRAEGNPWARERVFTVNDKTNLPAGLAAMAALAVSGGALATLPAVDEYFDPAYLQASAR